MAININQLTQQLRMLPDAVLQRVAQMYKQDPYILPMIVSEGMARKQLRMAGQARTVAPQPKVNDQALMALSEQSQQPVMAAGGGLLALKAPNIQNMADGGIAGYDDVFDAAGESVVRMSDGGVARYQAGGQSVGVTPYGGIYGGQRLLPTTTGYEGMSIDEFLKAAYNDVSDVVKRLYDKVPKESLAQVVAEDLAKKKSQEAAQRPAAGGARSVGIGGPRVGEREAYEQQAAGQTPPAQGKPSAAPGAAPGAPARAAAQPSVESAKLTAAQFLDKEAIERQAKEYEMTETTAVDEARRRRQKARDEQGVAYEGYEAAIKKEEEGAKGELEQSKAMAILNAGLAMMAGTSPRALENIGKGAMVGTGQYAEAIKDFKKAAKERQRAIADIEQARRAEARADTQEQLKFEERADDKLSNARKFGIEALMNAGVKTADMARQIYTTQVEQQGATERARMQDPLALFKALGKGDVSEGYRVAQQEKREPMTEGSLRQEWAKSPILQMNYPNIDDFIKMMLPKGQTAGTSVDTSGFKVLGVRNP